MLRDKLRPEFPNGIALPGTQMQTTRKRSRKRKRPVSSPGLPRGRLRLYGARSTNTSFEAARDYTLVVLRILGALRSKLPSGF